jgi:hypothetical protein
LKRKPIETSHEHNQQTIGDYANEGLHFAERRFRGSDASVTDYASNKK